MERSRIKHGCGKPRKTLRCRSVAVPAPTVAGKDSGESRRVEGELCVEQPAQLSVSPALFNKFQKLIYAETGIWLGSSKTALLCGRLYRRLRELGLESLERYYERVAGVDQDEERAR